MNQQRQRDRKARDQESYKYRWQRHPERSWRVFGTVVTVVALLVIAVILWATLL